MAKFNQNATIKTENRSGNAAYSMKAKEKLVTQVLTSFFNENKYYGDNSAEIIETLKEVIKTDPQFVSNLAAFSRREFNMRTISHVLTAYLAHEPEGKPYVKETLRGVTLRGDDLTEIMSFYLAKFGKPIPNCLRKGIKNELLKFDEYTLAKYKGIGKTVKMRDLICLCRPNPKNEEQSALFKRCLEDKLKTPLTWETQLSQYGNNSKTWENLIDSGKVGYMALLRNLRNIITAAPRNIEKVYLRIEDPDAIKKSKQLPFRFLEAYKAIADIGSSRAFESVCNAANRAVENMNHIPGRTVIAVDSSGSMSMDLSQKSNVRCCEIGAMLGVLTNRICDDSIFYTFNHEIKKRAIPKNADVITSALAISDAWGATDMHLPFEEMLNNKIEADRVIIISDNECNSTFNNSRGNTTQFYVGKYNTVMHRDIWVHAIDLQGYGTQQFCGYHTNIISGWSEKVLSFISLAERGEGDLESTIANYIW